MKLGDMVNVRRTASARATWSELPLYAPAGGIEGAGAQALAAVSELNMETSIVSTGREARRHGERVADVRQASRLYSHVATESLDCGRWWWYWKRVQLMGGAQACGTGHVC